MKPPEYYAQEFNITDDEILPFSRRIRADPQDGGLYTAEPTSISWHIPESDKLQPDVLRTLEEQAPDDITPFRDDQGHSWIRVGNYNATYSPEKLRMWFNGQFKDNDLGFINPLWRTTTQRYGIINPVDGYGPMEDALRDLGLADSFYGNFRLYDRGGTWYMTGLFDVDHLRIDIDGDPVRIGFQSGSDVYGNLSFFAEGFAQDTYCVNSMYALTDKKRRKHASPDSTSHLSYDDFVEWWEAFFTEMFDITSDLEAAIQDARDVTLDVTELPFDIEGFYELMGFPNGNQTPFASLAKVYARSRATDQFRPTMWDLHSGATAVLEHEWDHSEGTTFRGYVQLANDLLFNPYLSVQRARNAFERRLEEEGVGGAETLGGQEALAVIVSFEDELARQADRWEVRQERLQTKIAVSEEEPEAEV